MKKSFLPTLAALVVLFSLTQITLGQSGKTLDDQFDSLINSQGRVASALEALVGSRKPTEEQLAEENAQLMALSSTGDILDCIEDAVANGPTSNTYQETEWDLFFLPILPAPGNNTWEREYFTDINGDGLMDYALFNTYPGATRVKETCIYINDGSNLVKAHVCRAYSGTSWTYWGDCAAAS